MSGRGGVRRGASRLLTLHGLISSGDELLARGVTTRPRRRALAERIIVGWIIGDERWEEAAAGSRLRLLQQWLSSAAICAIVAVGLRPPLAVELRRTART